MSSGTGNDGHESQRQEQEHSQNPDGRQSVDLTDVDTNVTDGLGSIADADAEGGGRGGETPAAGSNSQLQETKSGEVAADEEGSPSKPKDESESALVTSASEDRDNKHDDDDDDDEEDDENYTKLYTKANWPKDGVKEPHENDVLYGRGGGTNHHPGNKRYRRIVEERKVEYVNSKRLEKPQVALSIIRNWRRKQTPPGRFLKLNERTGLWDDVGDKKAREKTSQALREKAPVLRKQHADDTDVTGGTTATDDHDGHGDRHGHNSHRRTSAESGRSLSPDGDPYDRRNRRHSNQQRGSFGEYSTDHPRHPGAELAEAEIIDIETEDPIVYSEGITPIQLERKHPEGPPPAPGRPKNTRFEGHPSSSSGGSRGGGASSMGGHGQYPPPPPPPPHGDDSPATQVTSNRTVSSSSSGTSSRRSRTSKNIPRSSLGRLHTLGNDVPDPDTLQGFDWADPVLEIDSGSYDEDNDSPRTNSSRRTGSSSSTSRGRTGNTPAVGGGMPEYRAPTIPPISLQSMPPPPVPGQRDWSLSSVGSFNSAFAPVSRSSLTSGSGSGGGADQGNNGFGSQQQQSSSSSSSYNRQQAPDQVQMDDQDWTRLKQSRPSGPNVGPREHSLAMNPLRHATVNESAMRNNFDPSSADGPTQPPSRHDGGAAPPYRPSPMHASSSSGGGGGGGSHSHRSSWHDHQQEQHQQHSSPPSSSSPHHRSPPRSDGMSLSRDSSMGSKPDYGPSPHGYPPPQRSSSGGGYPGYPPPPQSNMMYSPGPAGEQQHGYPQDSSYGQPPPPSQHNRQHSDASYHSSSRGGMPPPHSAGPMDHQMGPPPPPSSSSSRGGNSSSRSSMDGEYYRQQQKRTSSSQSQGGGGSHPHHHSPHAPQRSTREYSSSSRSGGGGGSGTSPPPTPLTPGSSGLQSNMRQLSVSDDRGQQQTTPQQQQQQSHHRHQQQHAPLPPTSSSSSGKRRNYRGDESSSDRVQHHSSSYGGGGGSSQQRRSLTANKSIPRPIVKRNTSHQNENASVKKETKMACRRRTVGKRDDVDEEGEDRTAGSSGGGDGGVPIPVPQPSSLRREHTLAGNPLMDAPLGDDSLRFDAADVFGEGARVGAEEDETIPAPIGVGVGGGVDEEGWSGLPTSLAEIKLDCDSVGSGGSDDNGRRRTPRASPTVEELMGQMNAANDQRGGGGRLMEKPGALSYDQRATTMDVFAQEFADDPSANWLVNTDNLEELTPGG